MHVGHVQESVCPAHLPSVALWHCVQKWKPLPQCSCCVAIAATCIDLAMALPYITALSKGCQVTAGIFGCHGRPGSMCRSRHPAGSVGEGLVRIAFLPLGVLAGNAEQVGGGVISDTWLKANHIPSTGVEGWGGQDNHLDSSPSSEVCCLVQSG